MQKKYKIKIPLTYNNFELKNINAKSTSEFRIEISGDVKEKIQSDEKIAVSLYNIFEKDESTPEPFIMCEIEGIISNTEDAAIKIADKILNKICMEMSFLFNHHNGNRHLYQPRVEPNWKKAGINSEKYSSPLIHKDDGIICFEDGITFKASLHITAILRISSNEFKINEWLKNATPEEDFICNEYYVALGSEKMQSKFFHLFSIIEFCEREYKAHNKSTLMLSADDVENIVKTLSDEKLNLSLNKNLLSRVKQVLSDATDIGRAQKLLNILKWMGITDFERFGQKISIDLDLLKNLILLRNKTFHGVSQNSENEIEYLKAVETLLYIGEKIINFLRKNLNRT